MLRSNLKGFDGDQLNAHEGLFRLQSPHKYRVSKACRKSPIVVVFKSLLVIHKSGFETATLYSRIQFCKHSRYINIFDRLLAGYILKCMQIPGKMRIVK